MYEFEIPEFHRDDYTISTEKSRLDVEAIHEFLTQRSYWSKNIPFNVVHTAIDNSLCYGVYEGERQVGFARVVTDYITFAFLMDVFILEIDRGKGLSKWLIECIFTNPNLQSIRRWMLATRDAHGLYARFGFQPLAHPERLMEIHQTDIFKTQMT